MKAQNSREFIAPFTVDVLFGGWSRLLTGLAILGVAAQILLPQFYQPSMPWGERIGFASAILFIFFVAKVLQQYWFAFTNGGGRIEVLGGLTAEKPTVQEFVIRLQSFPSAREGQILALYAGGSGIPQSIGAIRVIDTCHDGIVVAVPIGAVSGLKKYFEEESRRQAMFALPTVTQSDLAIAETE